MHFLNSQVLWSLLILPPLGMAAVWYAWHRKKRLLAEYGDWSLVARFASPLGKALFVGKALLVALGLASLILALARPSSPHSRIEYPQGTTDVVAVVDVSRSIATQDYQGKIPGEDYKAGTRLDMGRYILLNNVVPSLGFNRLGVVTFAGESFPLAFVTDDMPALSWVLKRTLKPGSAPGQGSQLADAFNMACLLFDLDSPPGHHRIIVLFSDGGNDSEDDKMAAAVDELKKRDIQLIIAGVGSKQPRPIPIAQLSATDQAQFADQQWYTENGQVVTSALDETSLISLKNQVGGTFVRITQPSDFDLGSLSSRTDLVYIHGERELFIYPLVAGLFLLGLAVLAPREPFRQPLSLRWRKQKPPSRRR